MTVMYREESAAFTIEAGEGGFWDMSQGAPMGPWETRGQAWTHAYMALLERQYLKRIPQPQQRWRHHNGVEYVVICLSNEHSERDEYPLTITYQGENGRIWSKPLRGFMKSMNLIPATGPVVVEPAPTRLVLDDGDATVEMDRLHISSAPLTKEQARKLLPYLAFFAAEGALPSSPIK